MTTAQPLLWDPPVSNTATDRALDAAANSKQVNDVPLNGTSSIKINIQTTYKGKLALTQALSVDNLEQEDSSTPLRPIQQVIDIALSHLERQGAIPDIDWRQQCILQDAELQEALRTTPAESVEHACSYSYNMNVIDLDDILTKLRVWAFRAQQGCVYQIGVITIAPGNATMFLYNTLPGHDATHTIFLVRTLFPMQNGAYMECWRPLVPSPRNEPTVPLRAGPSTSRTPGDRKDSAIDLTQDEVVVSDNIPRRRPGSRPSAIPGAYRPGRSNIPDNPHHVSAIPYTHRTAEDILSLGSGVDTDRMYGRLILYLGLFLRNVQISKMLDNKRQNEENQKAYAKGSNQAWHRMREALRHCLGPDEKGDKGDKKYQKNLKAYQDARNGDPVQRQRFLDIVRRPDHTEYITPEDCSMCKAPTASSPNASAMTTPNALIPAQNQTFPIPGEQPTTRPGLGSRKRPHDQVDNTTTNDNSRKYGKTQPANLPALHQNDDFQDNEPSHNDQEFCVWCNGDWFHVVDCPIAWMDLNQGTD